ncbi:MAG TPA: hypothetical protein DCL44_05780 [Elusimicrobia bacterium]|nr:hypothetical protein [Elusimicrobiota bacterium]
MAEKEKKESAGPAAAASPEAEARFPAWLVWGIFSVWGFVVLKSYLARFTPDLNSILVILSPGQYFAGAFLTAAAGHSFNLLAGFFFILSCAGLGRFLLAILPFAAMNLWEEITFSAALGLAAFANAVLCLAAAGLLYKAAVLSLLFISLCLGVLSFKLNPFVQEESPAFKPGFADVTALALLAAALLLDLAGALSPETFYDALVYHLAVPNFYALKNSLADMPYNIYSNLFLLHGMLYSAGLLLTDEFVPKLINYAAGFLSVLAVLGLGRRYFTFREGLWAALIFYTATHALTSSHMASWSSGTEALLTFFSLTALAAVLRYEPGAKIWLLSGAFLAGSAMAVKSTGLFSAAGMALVLFYRQRGNSTKALRGVLLFCLIAAIPVTPWLIKNQIYRHNPVYPFLTSVFGLPQKVEALKIQGFINEARHMGALELRSWLIHPWKITMGEMGDSQYFTPIFLFMLPLLFLLGPAAPAARPFWLYFLAFWLLWSLVSTMGRFLMPAYPAAALLIAAAIKGRKFAALKKILSCAVLFICAMGLYWEGIIFYSQERWRPLLGLETKREYLSSQSALPYAAVEFINDGLTPEAKTLIVGDSRSFYFKKDFIASSVFDKTPVVEWSAASKTGEELYARMKSEGVTHILLNTAEAIRLGRTYGMFYWDSRARDVFNVFWNAHLKEVFARDQMRDGSLLNRVAVYEVVPSRPGKIPPPVNLMEELVMKNIDRKPDAMK